MKYIDIPSEQMLPDMEAGIKEQLKDVKIPGVEDIKVEKIEWTAEGLRIWMVKELEIG